MVCRYPVGDVEPGRADRGWKQGCLTEGLISVLAREHDEISSARPSPRELSQGGVKASAVTRGARSQPPQFTGAGSTSQFTKRFINRGAGTHPYILECGIHPAARTEEKEQTIARDAGRFLHTLIDAVR